MSKLNPITSNLKALITKKVPAKFRREKISFYSIKSGLYNLFNQDQEYVTSIPLKEENSTSDFKQEYEMHENIRMPMLRGYRLNNFRMV